MRQLNIYNFHKSQPKISSQREFENEHFKRNQPQELCLIKRKSKPDKHRKQNSFESTLVTVSSQETYQSSIDPNEIEEIKSNVINVAQNLLNLKRKMLTMQKQYNILTYYKEELGTINERIQNELYSITEKEHSLQHLFFCILGNFFPSFITKEQLLLPDEENVDTSVNHYNEVINQIIRKIKNFYLKANPDKDSIILCQRTAAAIGQRIEDEITPSFNRVEDLYKNYFDPNYKCIPQDFCKKMI